MKKVLSFILALTLLMGMSALFVNAEESTDYFFIPSKDGEPGVETYGFKNTEYWDNVYVYATGGRSEDYEDSMTYPGVKLNREYVDGYGYIYTFSFAVGYYGTLVFNDGTKNDYKAELKKDFYDYCVQKLGKPSYNAQVMIEKTDKYHDGTVLFAATSWEEPLNMSCNVIIDNYCYHRSATFSPYDLGIYVSTNDEIYTLEEALNEDLIMGVSLSHGISNFEYHRINEDVDLSLMHKCLYAFGDRYGYNPQEGESIYCEPLGSVGDYEIFHAYFSHYMYPAIIAQEQIGDYYFTSGAPYGIGENNSVAIYALSPEGKVYTLYEAYTQGLITELDEVVKLTGGTSIYGQWGKRILELLDIDIMGESWQHLYRQISPSIRHTNEATPDFVMVLAAESTIDETPCVKRIGNYAVANEKTYAPYDLGYFVYATSEDKVYNLEDAFEAYPDNIERFLEMIDYPTTGHYLLIGNVDYDNKITIKDATRIQKRLAGYEMSEHSIPELELEASDFNGDGKVNIRDATAIQKFIAGLEY